MTLRIGMANRGVLWLSELLTSRLAVPAVWGLWRWWAQRQELEGSVEPEHSRFRKAEFMTATASRRGFIVTAATTATAALSLPNVVTAADPKPTTPTARFKFGLNTSTIRGQKLIRARDPEKTQILGKARAAAFDRVTDELAKPGQG